MIKLTCKDRGCPSHCRVFLVDPTPRKLSRDSVDLLAWLDTGDDRLSYRSAIAVQWQLAGIPLSGYTVYSVTGVGYRRISTHLSLGDNSDFDGGEDWDFYGFARWCHIDAGQRFFEQMLRRIGGRLKKLASPA